MPPVRTHNTDDSHFTQGKPNKDADDELPQPADRPMTLTFPTEPTITPSPTSSQHATRLEDLPGPSTSFSTFMTPTEIQLPQPTTQPRPSHSKRRDASYIPRPPNAFILFRSSFIRSQQVTGKVEGNHSNLSKIIGMYWKTLPQSERDEWEAKALAAQVEHRKRYPDWRFRPGATTAAHLKLKDSTAPSRRRRVLATKDPPDGDGETSRSPASADASGDRDEAPTDDKGKGKAPSRGRSRVRGRTVTDAMDHVKPDGKDGHKARDEQRLAKIAGLLGEGKKGVELEAAVQQWERDRRTSGRAQHQPKAFDDHTSFAVTFFPSPSTSVSHVRSEPPRSASSSVSPSPVSPSPLGPSSQAGSPSPTSSWPATPMVPYSGQFPHTMASLFVPESHDRPTYLPPSSVHSQLHDDFEPNSSAVPRSQVSALTWQEVEDRRRLEVEKASHMWWEDRLEDSATDVVEGRLDRDHSAGDVVRDGSFDAVGEDKDDLQRAVGEDREGLAPLRLQTFKQANDNGVMDWSTRPGRHGLVSADLSVDTALPLCPHKACPSTPIDLVDPSTNLLRRRTNAHAHISPSAVSPGETCLPTAPERLSLVSPPTISSFSSLAGWDGEVKVLTAHPEVSSPSTAMPPLHATTTRTSAPQAKFDPGVWQAGCWGHVQPVGLQGGTTDWGRMGGTADRGLSLCVLKGKTDNTSVPP